MWPWVNRGVFRHRHDCPTTRRVSMERPGLVPADDRAALDLAYAEWERNHTCDCPGKEFENEAQDDLNQIVDQIIKECKTWIPLRTSSGA